MNDGRFDGGQLSSEERSLRDFYRRLLSFSAQASALTGEYLPPIVESAADAGKAMAFVRWSGAQKLLIVASFDGDSTSLRLTLPATVIKQWQLADGSYPLRERLYGQRTETLKVLHGIGSIDLQTEPLASLILELEQ